MFELSDDDIIRLRDQFRAVGYTVDGVHEHLGAVAHAALHRNETTPGLRATSDPSPLATLIRLWLLQASVARTRATAALADLLEPLVAAGILHVHGTDVCALADIRPYGVMGGAGGRSGPADEDWWVVADLTPGMDGSRPTVPSDHVLGVNSAATTLAQLTVRRPGARALDIGTGCGVQALHLAAHATHIVGTDVNPRALAMARLSARLNGLAVTSDVPGAADADLATQATSGQVFELRVGGLFEPVDGDTFDLIVSNPPFVISPRGGLTYRDSGMAGDEVCRQIVVQAPRHLSSGGVCQLLANWLHVRGEDWRDRLAGWLIRTGCDAWVVQREVSDPAEYVEVWLRDAGLHGAAGYRERFDEWLAWFEAQDAEAVGYGWIILRKPEAGAGAQHRIEELTGPVAQPLGAEVARWLDAIELLRTYDEDKLAAACLQVAEYVDQEQLGRPGAADPEHVVLRQRSGMCRAILVDTAEAGFVGGCDGTLPVGAIIGALATLLEEDEDGLRVRLIPRIRQLVEEGYLSLPGSAGGA